MLDIQFNKIKPYFIIFTKNFFSDTILLFTFSSIIITLLKRVYSDIWKLDIWVRRYSRVRVNFMHLVQMMSWWQEFQFRIHEDVDQRTFRGRLETNLTNIKATSCNEIKGSRRKHGLDRFCPSTGSRGKFQPWWRHAPL